MAECRVEHLGSQHRLVVLTQGIQQWLIWNQSQATSDTSVVVTETAAVEGFLDARVRRATGRCLGGPVARPRDQPAAPGHANGETVSRHWV